MTPTDDRRENRLQVGRTKPKSKASLLVRPGEGSKWALFCPAAPILQHRMEEGGFTEEAYENAVEQIASPNRPRTMGLLGAAPIPMQIDLPPGKGLDIEMKFGDATKDTHSLLQ